MFSSHRWQFLRRYLADPTCVGAVAPSSRALAAALCAPFERRSRPARVLEVGAGTGPVTRHLGSLLQPGDELDICEIQPDLADILERSVLTRGDFVDAVAEGRVRLFRTPLQALSHENHYDYVVSGLPLTAFTLREVREVFRTIHGCLKPGGVLSYFEYIALRKTSRALSLGRKRRRIRTVSAYLSRAIRDHQFERSTVFQNFPPAHARHLRFD